MKDITSSFDLCYDAELEDLEELNKSDLDDYDDDYDGDYGNGLSW